MDAKFSPRVREVISLSREEALRLGHNYIGVEHLLLGIIKEGEGTAVRILEGLNCDLQKLRKLVEGSVRPSAAKPGGSSGNIPLGETSGEDFEDHLPRGQGFQECHHRH